MLYDITNDPLDNAWYHSYDTWDHSYDEWDHSYDECNYSYNTIHLSGRPGWEIYFPQNEKGYLDLVYADKKFINDSVFRSSIPELQNQTITKEDLYISFKNTLNTSSLRNYKLDQSKYIRRVVMDEVRFEYLYWSILSNKSSNVWLELKWWDLCYIYGLSHHKDIPFDLNDIKSHTPQTFYNYLEIKKNNNTLNDYWKRALNKYQDKPESLYAYVRISNFVITYTKDK